jgi:pyruvate carboxylase subunit B
MADLGNNLASLNKWLKKRNKPELTQDELLVKLFNEVEKIWPMVGYPPLVTPYSQYVKNLALMNVMQIVKGKERWSMIADNIWDMLMGKGGQLPGKLAPELQKLATAAGKEPFTDNPQSLYPDKLDEFRAEMDKNGWDYGQDDEELFELAMHPEQYRSYKSGKAKADFEADLAKCKAEGAGLFSKSAAAATAVSEISSDFQPTAMNINVGGENFKVTVSYGEGAAEAAPASSEAAAPVAAAGPAKEILAPLEGKFYLTKDSSETAIKVGDTIKEGDLIGYVEAMKTFNAIKSDVSGQVVEIVQQTASDIEEDDVLIRVK